MKGQTTGALRAFQGERWALNQTAGVRSLVRSSRSGVLWCGQKRHIVSYANS